MTMHGVFEFISFTIGDFFSAICIDIIIKLEMEPFIVPPALLRFLTIHDIVIALIKYFELIMISSFWKRKHYYILHFIFTFLETNKRNMS